MTLGELFNEMRFTVNQQDVNRVNAAINQISSTAKRLLGMIGIGISLTQLNRMAEEYDAMGDKLSAIAEESDNITELHREMAEHANNCKMDYSQMVGYAAKIAQSNRDVFPVKDAAEFVEYTTKLGRAYGQSESEIGGMLTVLQRSISAGKMSAGQIEQIITRYPALAEQLQKALGKDTDGLRAMAKQGQLTAETLKQAMKSSVNDIDNAYSRLGFNISDAMQRIRNLMTVWIGETDQQFQITQRIADFMVKSFEKFLALLTRVRNGVIWLSQKVGGMNNLIRLLTFLVSALFIVMNWNKITTGLKTVLGLVKAIFSPLGLLMAVLLGIYLLVDDFIGFLQGKRSFIGYLFHQAGIDLQEMRNKIVNIWNNIKTFFSNVWNAIQQILQPHLDKIKQKLEEVFGSDFFSGLGNGIAGIIEFFERLTKTLAEDPEAAEKFGKGLTYVVQGLLAILGLVAVIKLITGITSLFHGLGSAGSKNQSKLSGFASAILMVVLALGALVAISAYLSQNSDVAGIFFGMAAAIAILIVVVGVFGNEVKAAGAGILMLGFGLALCAGAMLLLVYAAQMMNDAGAGTWVALSLMAALIVALVVIMGVFGEQIALAGAGIMMLGAGLALAGVGALLAAASLAVITLLLPLLIQHGSEGAAVIMELAGSLVAFAGSVAAAGIGALAGSVGLGALAVVVGLLILVTGPLAEQMKTTADAIEIISDKAGLAGDGLGKMKGASSDIKSNIKDLAKALPELNEPLTEFSVLVVLIAPLVQAAFVMMNEAISGGVSSIVNILSPMPGKAKRWGMDFINNLIAGIELRLHALVDEMNTVVGIMDLSGVIGGTYAFAYAGGTPNSGTVGNVTNNNRSTKTINQTNNFNNTFTGTDRENQRRGGSQMNVNADDAIDRMTRAMAGL